MHRADDDVCFVYRCRAPNAIEFRPTHVTLIESYLQWDYSTKHYPGFYSIQHFV